jgi:signal transduction histidine kinase
LGGRISETEYSFAETLLAKSGSSYSTGTNGMYNEMNRPALFIGIALFFFQWCHGQNLERRNATGILDASQEEIQGYRALSGYWKFFPNKLLTPEELTDDYQAIRVPSSWTTVEKMQLYGTGTYAAEIILPQSNGQLVLCFPNISGAARIWINDRIAIEKGSVAGKRKDYRGTIGAYIIYPPLGVRKINVLVQVSNFSFASSGIISTPVLAEQRTIERSMGIDRGVGNIFAGSLLAIAIMHIILYFLYRKEKTCLYLALICFCIAARSILLNRGSLLAPDIFPHVEGEYFKKLEYFSVYLLIIFFPNYVYATFPNNCPAAPIKIFSLTGVVFSCLALLAPMTTYTSLLDYAHVIFVIEFIFAGYVFYINRKTRDAFTIFLGIGLSLPLITIEMMANSGLFRLPFYHLVEAGVLIFFIFQMYMLATRNARAFFTAEHLNRKLEVVVSERTAELTKSNQIKDSLLSVLSHDLKSPINTLKGLLHLYNRRHVSELELQPIMQDMEKNVNNTSMLLDNLLSWSASQSAGIRINKAKIHLEKIVQQHLSLFETQAQAKKISIISLIPESSFAFTDGNVLSLILRNLLSNAIKFTRNGGHITISAVEHQNKLSLIIKDNGVGMDQATVHKLLHENHTTNSTTGTQNEKGHGLGITLCKTFVDAMGGSIDIKSSPGKGTSFIISLEACNEPLTHATQRKLINESF